jgi:predicted dehydrogenase
MLWSQGSHYIDSLMCWFGDVDSVWGRVFTHAPARTREDGTMVLIDADDAFEATLTFATGGVAHVSMSYLAAFGKGGGFELYGDAGTLVTPQTSNTPNPPAHGVVLGARVGDVDGLQEMPVPTHLEPIEDDRDMRLAPTRLLLRDFARGVEDGESPSPNFEDGYQLQRVLQGIRDASLSGQTMNLSKE